VVRGVPSGHQAEVRELLHGGSDTVLGPARTSDDDANAESRSLIWNLVPESEYLPDAG
jgi:hypothetical protein